MIGDTVSHYRIGEGGMGAVYLATDTKLKRRVALKFLPDELTQDEERRDRFVRTDLAQTPGLDLVSSQRVQEILNQIGSDNVDSIDRNIAAEVARRSGAGAVVVGSIFKAGDEIRIDVQVEDVGSGRVITAESVRGSEIFPLVDELSGRIRMGLRFTETGTNRPLVDISTDSMEAYRLYVEGREAVVNLREPQARRLFEEAVRRDPGFAMAHFELSVLLPQWGQDLADEQERETLSNLGRLSERERLVVESTYAQRDEPERAVRLAEELVSRYPGETRGYRVLVNAHRALGNPERALEALELGVAANPASGELRNVLGYELLRNGRPDEALEAFREYEQLHPGEANPYDSQGELFLLTGRPDRAIERFDRALEIDPSFNAVRFPRIWANAMLGRYNEALQQLPLFTETALRERFLAQYQHLLRASLYSRAGWYSRATDEIANGMHAAEGSSDLGGRIELALLKAWFSLEKSELDATINEARLQIEDARTLEEQNPTWARNVALVAHLLAGAAEARRGELDAASRHLDEVKEQRDPGYVVHTYWYRALEGEVALAAGEAPRAKQAFAAIEPTERMFFDRRSWGHTIFANCLPFRDGVARADRALGDTTAAIDSYRTLLEPGRSPNWISWLEPRYVLALARLLDESGRTSEARVEYERFLEMWQGADENLPEVAEARDYLTAQDGVEQP